MRATVKRPTLLLLWLVAACSGCGSASEAPVQLPARAVSIGVAPDNYGTLWAVTAGAAYRSQDGGHDWLRVPKAPGGDSITFAAKHTLLAGVGGLATATFGGTAVRPLSRPPAPLVAVTSPFFQTNRVYALDSRGRLWLSASGGRQWVAVRALGLPADARAIAARRASVVKPDTIFAAAGRNGLWVSRNFGSSFRRDPAVRQATAVATTPHDATRVLVADAAGLLLSTDDGRSFRRVLDQPGITAITLDTRNWKNAFASTSSGRLLRSSDGGVSWTL
jgi:photosystem II stability/assembly factor-like uncharacterized protein